MKTFQKEIQLPAYKRGFHLITRHIVDNFAELKKLIEAYFKFG